MHKVSEHLLSQVNATLWIAEASTLRFPPGVWPDYIAVVPVVGTDFVFQRNRELQQGSWEYKTNDLRNPGATIEVLND